MPDYYETHELVDILAAALSEPFSAAPGIDWNDQETIAYESLSRSLSGGPGAGLSRQDVYLGGDALRPYLAVHLGGQGWLISGQHRTLSTPRLLAEVDSGKFGSPRSFFARRSHVGYVAWSLAATRAVSTRLVVPNVYLLSLTNASRYRTRRYPLNIGRLAQWLRFQHAGRVMVSDLALSFAGDLQVLSHHVVSSHPDIVGISLNFGELESFRRLIWSIRDANARPTICVGNVLAAWAPDEVKEICVGFDLFISYSYGESDLERVCLSFGQEVHKAEQSDGTNLGGGFHGPTAIVFPDEYLLAETLRQSGQASIETSFGCQYGRCSFCPRDHRGKGWQRPAPQAPPR